jgi:hypothetical protein
VKVYESMKKQSHKNREKSRGRPEDSPTEAKTPGGFELPASASKNKRNAPAGVTAHASPFFRRVARVHGHKINAIPMPT